MKFKSNKAGICPFCNSDFLNYDELQYDGNMGYFKWICSACGGTGEELYEMSFKGHNVDTNDGIVEIINEMIQESECENNEYIN